MSVFTTVTIGCKVNQYETQAVAGLLVSLGLIAAETGPDKHARHAAGPKGDLLVINTCCVTASAAGKSRRAIRRALRANGDADVLILGCYATAEPEALHQVAVQAGATGGIYVVGHHADVAEDIHRCVAFMSEHGRQRNQTSGLTGPVRNEIRMRARPCQQNPAEDLSSPNSIKTSRQPDVKRNFSRLGTAGLPPIETFAAHQRAFVKVQDGCDAGCSYCIIPRLRSRVWSRPMEDVLAEVADLVSNGHKEVVLCGVFLGAFGRATAIRRRWTSPAALPELLRRVAETPGLWRARLSSLDVGDVTDEMLEVFRDCPAVAPHLHLPLQSGSDRILGRMNRQYGAADFLDAVRRVRQTINDAAVTTDILVGFPGETEEDFAATLNAARRAEFSKIHVFPYSPRPGTAAWSRRAETPPSNVIKARCRQLAELGDELAKNFRRRFIGRTVEALVEQPNSKTPPACARSLTDRYVEVHFPLDEGGLGRDEAEAHLDSLVGKVVTVRITGLSETGLMGSL